MNKKAQDPGEIFTYIMSIIVVAIVLMYGYSAVKMLMEKSQRAGIETFKETLRNEVKKGSSSNDRTKAVLSLGGDYNKVCFFNSNLLPREISPDQSTQIPLVTESSAAKQNVYLIGDNKNTIESFFVEGITNTALTCVSANNGRLVLWMTGNGIGVSIDFQSSITN